MPHKPPKFHEIFTSITNNYRFIPFDSAVAPAAVRVPGTAADGENTRPALDHSTPLPDGYSGRITMHWVARTPVLFGGKQIDGITTPQKLHCGKDAPYCIPGSSLRGMIRRLLRIATRGKATPVADSRPVTRTYDRKTRMRGEDTSKYSVHQILERTQPGINDRDWSEAMLGYVDGEGRALRGRIDFGFAKALGEPKLFPSDGSYIKIVQGQPRPGFFPFYLRRTGQGELAAATYDSETGHLAGRKFYPAWNSAFVDLDTLPRWNKGDTAPGEMDSRLQFLDRGTIFSGRIDVHNLLPEELGALLWVLSLGEGWPFRAFDPAEQGAPPYDMLSPYCHIAGRARAFSFGNLIPAGIDLTGIAAHSGGAIPTPEALIAAFARKVHGCTEADDLYATDWLNRQPRLARLRYLSWRERDPDTVGPRSPNPALSSPVERVKNEASKAMFGDYKTLRNVLSGAARNDCVAANLAAAPRGEMGGNILDLGSDPDRP